MLVAEAEAESSAGWRNHLQRFIDLGVNHSPGLRRRILRLTTQGSHLDTSEAVVELPALPSGERLSLSDTTTPHDEAVGSQCSGPPLNREADKDEDEEKLFELMWNTIEGFIDDDAVGDYVIGTAGEIWPANAALCTWLRSMHESIRGTSVLELGAGAGACGLYAAALGASRVLLTDLAYESDVYRNLCEANVEANRALFEARGARVDLAPLRWGDAGSTKALLQGAGQAFDWVLVCDCTFGQYALGDLCQTISSLLRSRPSRPPRIIICHEHRYRGPEGERGIPWLREKISRWDEGDECLEELRACAEREGLHLTPLLTQRPQMKQRGYFRWWSADVSIVEVDLRPSDAGTLPYHDQSRGHTIVGASASSDLDDDGRYHWSSTSYCSVE